MMTSLFVSYDNDVNNVNFFLQFYVQFQDIQTPILKKKKSSYSSTDSIRNSFNALCYQLNCMNFFSSSELASVCLGTGRKIDKKIDVVDIVIITNKQRCHHHFQLCAPIV